MTVVTLDERGRLCPLPVIALARAAGELPAGGEIIVLADDPAADHDIPAWCRMRGHEFTGAAPATGGGTAYRVRLGGGHSGAGVANAGGSSTAAASSER